MDDRKKLGMVLADPMNRSEWRGGLRGRLVKQVQPSEKKTGFNMDMMMMMVRTCMAIKYGSKLVHVIRMRVPIYIILNSSDWNSYLKNNP